MKKTLLAAATLSALMASGMANAAFTDADGSGGWTDSLEFNGTITSTNPAWKYQIPEATIAGAKDWNVKRSDGIVDGSNTNFTFTGKNFTVLEGVMKEPAPQGGAGLQPVITFGETGKTVVWDTTNTSMATPTAITVQAKKGTNVVGSLDFILIGQAAAQAIGYTSGGGLMGTWAEVTYTPAAKAFALLKSQPYYASTYDGIRNRNNTTAYPLGQESNSTKYLTVPTNKKASSALIADASNFKLTVPSTSIPDAWTATLPISITVK